MAWDDPRTLALLGASAGFLDPRGGPAMGFQGAVNGMQAGNRILQQRSQSEESKNKLAKQLEQESILKDLAIKHGGNTQGMLQDMLSSGNTDLMLQAAKIAGGLKGQYLQSQGPDGTGTYQFANSLGQVTPTGIPLKPEKLMQINRGSQIDLANPFTGEAQKSLGVGITPGQSAQLAQSDRHHNQNYALDLVKAQNAITQTRQPQFKDGYWITPPNMDNPKGSMIATDLATAPKGSEMEKTKLSGKIREILGDDTEELIKKSTGSTIGSAVDTTASIFGASTSGAEANAKLKIRANTLAGSMPRFEGPQSDADRRYYLEMAGNLADASIPASVKLQSLNELKRIHKLVDNTGSISQSIMPSNGAVSGASGGWSVQRIE